MMNKTDGTKKVVGENGVEMGVVESEQEDGFWVREGPIARYWIAKAFAERVTEEEVLLAGSISWLFVGREVEDANGRMFGKVREVIAAEKLLDLLVIDVRAAEMERPPVAFILPEWISKVGLAIVLNRTVDDVLFHQEDHSFREEIAHFVDGHV